MARRVHVIGAGLAGLAAAVRLAERRESIILYEAATQAGGRCRSYHDPVLGMPIDNGNHLVLSANHAALAYLARIGAAGTLAGPEHADFAFVDLTSGERWTLRINDGPVPWWIWHKKRRVPGTAASEYLAFAKLLLAPQRKTICQFVRCAGPLYERLGRPLWLAALNTDPKEASAGLAGAVTRETLARGGRYCRPLIARDGLSQAFIEPALRYLRARNGQIEFGHRLRKLEFSEGRVAVLDFGEEKVAVGAEDTMVLAVPATVARDLVPELATPSEFHAIVNAHFRIDPPAGLAPILGVVNGTIEWLFAFPGRLSVTISAADRLLEVPREQLAQEIWREVATVARLPPAMPAWQIVRERRATFAATPEQEVKRPFATTAWANLFLAGDWTRTGLPATIEGAIRSGNRAADLVAKLMGIS
jgi:squalene-associated FAD-dependent desaturase